MRPMKVFVIATTTFAGILLGIYVVRWFADKTTTQSLSPDEAYRVSLVEVRPKMPGRIDRNVKVCFATLDKEDKHEIKEETLFTSPDEGKPIGSERFIWSKDSAYVLLVGKHFFVAAELPLRGGEQAYFLYHVPSKRSWCNSRQIGRKHGKLSESDLRGIDFVQPVLLCPGPSLKEPPVSRPPD
jgi:hypothetical protein